jgi:hypothetical protein
MFRSIRRTRAAAFLFPLLALAGCQTPAPPRDSAVLAEPVARALAPVEGPRYMIDPRASTVRILLFRDGPLARFGHNHVIVGRVRGQIHAGETAAASGFWLEIPVESFTVDPQAARAEEGEDFSAEVSAQARDATRDNMLGADVLDAAAHPLIRVESLALTGPMWNPTVTARMQLRGVTRDLRFPAAVFRDADALAVIASFRIWQTDFGIQPFTALNGGLLLRDAIELRVRIVARRSAR